MRNAKIASGGMGGFLNPPGHPEHSFHVANRFRTRDGEFSMCLSSATEDWLDEETRSEAKALLSRWETEKLPLDEAKVQAWIRQILGYFKGCYRNPEVSGEKQWHASHILIKDDRFYPPMEHVAEHCGVRFIRSYYPEFVPIQQHFDEAQWGERS